MAVDPQDPDGSKFDQLAKEIEAMGKHPWKDRPGEKDESHVIMRPPPPKKSPKSPVE